MTLSDAERRLHARRTTADPVTVVRSDGQVFAASVVDRSLKGLRLSSDAVAGLTGELAVVSRSEASVLYAKVVWRTPPYAGLAVSRTVDMRTAAGSESVEARRLWREHVQS